VQRVDGDRHSVHGVGSLLDEIFHHAHALVVGLLKARDGVLKLLDLSLQLHHVLVDGQCGGAAEEHGSEKGCSGKTGRLNGETEVVGMRDHGRSTLGFLSSCQPSRDGFREG
jgi:hypothetical protein